MSTLYRAEQRTEAAALHPADGRTGASGVYLTDEVFLYRIVDVAALGTDDMVQLEDCYGLDVVEVRLKDLRARRLRVIRPTAPA